MLLRRILSTVVAVAALSALAAPAHAAETKVVASGLDNPRGLDFSVLGALYVAEAGRGAPAGAKDPECFAGPEGEACYGATGAITRIWHGKQERVAKGLPSLANREGEQATGPHDVSAFLPGLTYFTMGLGGSPERRQAVVKEVGREANLFGRLVRLQANGKPDSVADLVAYEASANPDRTDVDSNPYGLIGLPGLHVVTDAGGNSLLSVGPNGRISTLATFPQGSTPPGIPGPRQFDAVPTSVALGPDGALYVGQLTGFPFPSKAANVYRVVPGRAPTVYASGFTNIIDVTFGKDGSMYVLELAANGLTNPPPFGQLTKVARDGTRTVLVKAESGALIVPGGVAVGHDGALYVTNKSTMAGAGEVLRIKP